MVLLKLIILKKEITNTTIIDIIILQLVLTKNKKKIKTDMNNFRKFDLSPIKKLINITQITDNKNIYLFDLVFIK